MSETVNSVVLQQYLQMTRNEIRKDKEKIKQIENEKSGLVQELSDTKRELERTTAKLTRMSSEIRELKNKYMEVQGEHNEKTADEVDFDASDECLFDYEYKNFKTHFTELHKKSSSLSQKCFSTRNSALIGEVSRKILSTTDISTDVKEELVALLREGSTELKKAVNELTALESQIPTSSSSY